MCLITAEIIYQTLIDLLFVISYYINVKMETESRRIWTKWTQENLVQELTSETAALWSGSPGPGSGRTGPRNQVKKLKHKTD